VDTATFRYYEMAGTAHNTVHKNVEVLPPALFPPFGLSLEDACLDPINSLADGPIFGSFLYNAMWQNMEDQVRFGDDPPHGDLIEVASGDVVRDDFDNALGGIRLPQLDVPTATYGPHNTVNPDLPDFLRPLLNLFCVLSGTNLEFDQATLDELYPRPSSYLSQFVQATNGLKQDGFLLSHDTKKLFKEAILNGP
jgi:hypothetical protein